MGKASHLSAVVAAILTTACTLQANQPNPYAQGSGGAVASASPEATEAGLTLLRQGGNAVDAAVATALALAVVHPQAGNLGGGGFALLSIDDTVEALDFREVAPAAASPRMFLNQDGTPKENASLVGGLAVGVPGTPAGLATLHSRFGKRPWRTVVAPAARLALQGFEVSNRLHNDLLKHQDLLKQFPESASLWFPDGPPVPAGTRVSLPELAAALNQYARVGAIGLTQGRFAQMLVETSRKYGGLISMQDLADYQPVWRQPIRFQAFGWEVASMPLPSSGGLILAETSGILERLHWDQLPHDHPRRYHLMIEAWRAAYADRFHLGDPSAMPWDPLALLSQDHLANRAAAIETDHAGQSDSIAPFHLPAPRESTETTHLSVIDADGNMVALTTTLNGSFGSGVTVAGGSFLLNNEMDDFTTVPGQPNLYGLVQGQENIAAPGKRMLSSMSPTLLWNGQKQIALGSPGGSRIPTTVFQVIIAITLDHLELDQAIAQKRIHHQWQPDTVFIENSPADPLLDDPLKSMFGHPTSSADPFGEVHAVSRNGALFESAADLRGPGAAGVVSDTTDSTAP